MKVHKSILYDLILDVQFGDGIGTKERGERLHSFRRGRLKQQHQ